MGELFIHVYIEKIIKVTIKFGKLKQVYAVGLVPNSVVISVDTILKAQPDHLEDRQFAIRIIKFQSGRRQIHTSRFEPVPEGDETTVARVCPIGADPQQSISTVVDWSVSKQPAST